MSETMAVEPTPKEKEDDPGSHDFSKRRPEERRDMLELLAREQERNKGLEDIEDGFLFPMVWDAALDRFKFREDAYASVEGTLDEIERLANEEGDAKYVLSRVLLATYKLTRVPGAFALFGLAVAASGGQLLNMEYQVVFGDFTPETVGKSRAESRAKAVMAKGFQLDKALLRNLTTARIRLAELKKGAGLVAKERVWAAGRDKLPPGYNPDYPEQPTK